MSQDDGTPAGCHLGNFVGGEEGWEHYLDRMYKDKEWGTHIELTAVADLLGIPILVTTDSDDEEEFQVWIYPTTCETTQLILLGFSCNHYYSLEGKKKLYYMKVVCIIGCFR